jgi:hypothetical protein
MESGSNFECRQITFPSSFRYELPPLRVDRSFCRVRMGLGSPVPSPERTEENQTVERVAKTQQQPHKTHDHIHHSSAARRLEKPFGLAEKSTLCASSSSRRK